MTETSKLDEPLSDADYDELEAFLGSNVVPQDCMDLEMLDGFLTAIVSGPELIQPSEWLPVLWRDSKRRVTPVFQNNDRAERFVSLVLPLQQSIRRTLAESPTRFKPLLYHAEAEKDERSPPEASAWCEGFMTGVLRRGREGEPRYAEGSSRDWMLPIGRRAYGDHDQDSLDWVDTE